VLKISLTLGIVITMMVCPFVAPLTPEVVFGIKLNGAWEVPGLLSYDPCFSTVRECRTFEPYSYAQYVFTPGCIPYIILDPTVGKPVSEKECVAYYTIPDGWEIAPMDSVGKDAAASFSTYDWKTRV
jgi:hypothetical protein